MNETIVLEKDRTVWWRPDWKWDGKNCSVAKFDVRAQDELQEQGGRSYSKFYTGDYGNTVYGRATMGARPHMDCNLARALVCASKHWARATRRGG